MDSMFSRARNSTLLRLRLRRPHTNTDPDRHSYRDTYTNADCDANGNTDAGPDRTDGLRAQGTGQAYGGSHMVAGNLGQHRHLP